MVSGATVWLISPPGSVTLGASGVVFGWLTYLIARGLYTRAPGQIAIGVVVLLLYGGILLGVLPTDSGISWQAHLGGADRRDPRREPPAPAPGGPALALTPYGGSAHAKLPLHTGGNLCEEAVWVLTWETDPRERAPT